MIIVKRLAFSNSKMTKEIHKIRSASQNNAIIGKNIGEVENGGENRGC